jgi:hypothetical protein
MIASLSPLNKEKVHPKRSSTLPTLTVHAKGKPNYGAENRAVCYVLRMGQHASSCRSCDVAGLIVETIAGNKDFTAV